MSDHTKTTAPAPVLTPETVEGYKASAELGGWGSAGVMTEAEHAVVELCDSHEALRREVPRLTEAVKLILADPYGCPACDSGVLRKGRTVHWDTCGYPRAKAAVEAIDAARRADATRNEE